MARSQLVLRPLQNKHSAVDDRILVTFRYKPKRGRDRYGRSVSMTIEGTSDPSKLRELVELMFLKHGGMTIDELIARLRDEVNGPPIVLEPSNN